MSTPELGLAPLPTGPSSPEQTTTTVIQTTSSGGGGFSLGPVAYISGICLLVTVALCLLVIACVLRRKDRRYAAALAAEQEAQLAAAAEAAQQEAFRAAHPPQIPVVIVQPDGKMTLAEKAECGCDTPRSGGSSQGDGLELADLESGRSGRSGRIGAAKSSIPPIGFRPEAP